MLPLSSISYPNTLVSDTNFFITDARATIQELMQYQMQAVPTIESNIAYFCINTISAA